MSARSLLILAALLSSSSVAAPAIDPQFGSHAVIQRDKPIVLTGTAEPGTNISLSFAGTSRETKASATGRWEAAFHVVLGVVAAAILAAVGEDEIEPSANRISWTPSGAGKPPSPRMLPAAPTRSKSAARPAPAQTRPT